MVAEHPSRISPSKKNKFNSFKSYSKKNGAYSNPGDSAADIGYGSSVCTKNIVTPDSCIAEFLEAKFKGSKKYTRDKCRWSLYRTKRILEEGGFDASPRKINEEAINYLLSVHRGAEKLDTYIKGEIAYLNRYLKFFKNYIILDMNIEFAEDMRVNVHWLEDDQVLAIYQAPKTPLQDLVIHLELDLGFRNAECCRLTLDDVYNRGTRPYFNVRGKGRGNGKFRTVAFRGDTKAILGRWLDEREKIVSIARERIPHWEDPGYLLLWCHYCNHPDVGYYKEHTGSLDDAVLEPLRKEVGFHFCNHDLRRTCGRRLFLADVPIETVCRILGHESTVETIRYIGINYDDMEAGLKKLDQYDSKKGIRRH